MLGVELVNCCFMEVQCFSPKKGESTDTSIHYSSFYQVLSTSGKLTLPVIRFGIVMYAFILIAGQLFSKQLYVTSITILSNTGKKKKKKHVCLSFSFPHALQLLTVAVKSRCRLFLFINKNCLFMTLLQ